MNYSLCFFYNIYRLNLSKVFPYNKLVDFHLQFHILLILADGQMEEAEATLSALVEASKYPLSIVMVGVGDGPWGLMEDCDDLLPARKFDNFQVLF